MLTGIKTGKQNTSAWLLPISSLATAIKEEIMDTLTEKWYWQHPSIVPKDSK